MSATIKAKDLLTIIDLLKPYTERERAALLDFLKDPTIYADPPAHRPGGKE